MGVGVAFLAIMSSLIKVELSNKIYFDPYMHIL